MINVTIIVTFEMLLQKITFFFFTTKDVILGNSPFYNKISFFFLFKKLFFKFLKNQQEPARY